MWQEKCTPNISKSLRAKQGRRPIGWAGHPSSIGLLRVPMLPSSTLPLIDYGSVYGRRQAKPLSRVLPITLYDASPEHENKARQSRKIKQKREWHRWLWHSYHDELLRRRRARVSTARGLVIGRAGC